MIGQVAALRAAVTTIAELHHEVSAGSVDVLDDAACRCRRSHQPPSHAAARRRDRRHGRDLPGRRRRRRRSGPTSSAARTRSPRCRPSAGTSSATTTPTARPRPATRRRRSGAASCPRSAFDPLAYGIPPRSLAAIEPVQLLASRSRAGRSPTPATPTASSTATRASVIFGAEAGTDLAGAYGFRAHVPAVLSATLPPALDDVAARADRGLVPRRARQRHRRPHRQPPRPRRRQLHRRRRLRLVARRASTSACKELRVGTSDMVLCGGADLHNGINDYLLFSSASTRCRRPASAARSTPPPTASRSARASACVVLKRLADAERDGDRIYAVIKGVGGVERRQQPRPDRAAQGRPARARSSAPTPRPACSPAEVGLVEAHGTGTVVGDRTELATLTEVFGAHGAAPAAVRARLGEVADRPHQVRRRPGR